MTAYPLLITTPGGHAIHRAYEMAGRQGLTPRHITACGRHVYGTVHAGPHPTCGQCAVRLPATAPTT